MNGLRPSLFSYLAAMLSLSASIQLALAGDETLGQRTRHEAIQEKWNELPIVEVGTSLKDIRFKTVVLDKGKVQVGKEVTHALAKARIADGEQRR